MIENSILALERKESERTSNELKTKQRSAH